MSKYVKTAHPMPTPSFTNHESPQQFDFRPMIASKFAEVQYLLEGLYRSPYYAAVREVSPRDRPRVILLL